MDARPVLEAEGLGRRFGDVVALDGLNLRVPAGSIYALLGANGAGKSTTIKLFLGFLEPSSGQARVLGRAVHEDPLAARRALAYIPENVALHERLSGRENLEYFARLGGTRLDRGRVDALLARVGLAAAAADRRVATYSKGMRQKVGIAIALAKDARGLLLDEPTSGLDPAASAEFSALVRGLAGDGVAVLMATHDLFRARADARHIGIMRAGRLVAEFEAAAVDHDELERLYLQHAVAA